MATNDWAIEWRVVTTILTKLYCLPGFKPYPLWNQLISLRETPVFEQIFLLKQLKFEGRHVIAMDFYSCAKA